MSDLAGKLAGMSRALDLRAYRHQVLASNIANADTPQYKARDFDFRQALQNAANGRAEGGLVLATTSARHIEGGGAAGMPALQYRVETQSAVDGNTVDMDVERAQIAENAMHYEILSRLVSDRIQGMRSALTSGQG